MRHLAVGLRRHLDPTPRDFYDEARPSSRLSESLQPAGDVVRPPAWPAGRWGHTVLTAMRRGLAGLLRTVPTLLVGAALCGLFYWGHTTNWTAPRFSELFAEERDKDDDEKKPPAKEPEAPTKHAWCEQHNVPEEQCVICHPELAAKTATAAELKPVSVTFDP